MPGDSGLCTAIGALRAPRPAEVGRSAEEPRRLPRSFRSWTSRVYVMPFLLAHEIVQKALLDQLYLHYLHAPDRPAHRARRRGGGRDFLARLRGLREETREADRGGKIAPGASRPRSHAVSRLAGLSAAAGSGDEAAVELE